MVTIILSFFLGASVGSFVNVLIDRTIAGQDWVRGRSHCDHCKKTLAWYDMIPIISFLVYGAKSRCCRTPLSWRYPMVEALVGLLFSWWLLVGFLFFQLATRPLHLVQPGFWLLTGIILAILMLSDLFYGVVLLPVVGLGYTMTIVYRLILLYFGAYHASDLISALGVSAVFFGLFWFLYRLTKGRGMADGDMYVAAYMGLILGWLKGVVALLLSFVIGAIVGVILIATNLRTRKDTLPFVPFMMLSTGIALLWGETIWRFLGY